MKRKLLMFVLVTLLGGMLSPANAVSRVSVQSTSLSYRPTDISCNNCVILCFMSAKVHPNIEENKTILFIITSDKK